MNLTRLHTGPRMSQVTVFNGVVYLAGQIPRANLGASIEEQTAEVLSNVERLLHEAGSDKSRILFCQIFLRSLDDFAGMSRVWDDWVVLGATPPRATVQAQLATRTCLIEVVTTAALA